MPREPFQKCVAMLQTYLEIACSIGPLARKLHVKIMNNFALEVFSTSWNLSTDEIVLALSNQHFIPCYYFSQVSVPFLIPFLFCFVFLFYCMALVFCRIDFTSSVCQSKLTFVILGSDLFSFILVDSLNRNSFLDKFKFTTTS